MDSRFELHKVHVVLDSTAQPLIIKPFGDVHRFHDFCETERWREWWTSCKRKDKGNVLYLGLGDDDDKLSTKERSLFLKAMSDSHSGTHKNIDSLIKKQIDKYVGELSWMGTRLMGMVTGNHFWQFDDQTTSTDYLCNKLNCKSLGYLSYIVVVVSFRNTGAKCRFDICACHGQAGGKLVGTSINQVDDLRRVFPSADLYLMGHDHQKGCWPSSSLVVNMGRDKKELILKQKEIYLARTGSFLKGYVPGKESYVAGRRLRPANLGTVSFEVKWTKHDKGNEMIKTIKGIC